MTVYVKWYGQMLQGELLDGETMGMKQVRIPLAGRHPVALFTPGHVSSSPDMLLAEREMLETSKYYGEKIKEALLNAKLEDFLPADDRQAIEKFKRENWDHQRNHLRIDALDEFYFLWKTANTPFGFVDNKPEPARYVVAVDPAEPGKDVSVTTTIPKMRCWHCAYLDYDMLDDRQESVRDGQHFCGLHGRALVDPDGQQQNLNSKGGCGFSKRKEAQQLTLFD